MAIQRFKVALNNALFAPLATATSIACVSSFQMESMGTLGAGCYVAGECWTD
jgi:hypothetical protein